MTIMVIVASIALFLLVSSSEIYEDVPAQEYEFGPGDYFSIDYTPLLLFIGIFIIIIIFIRQMQ